jgi:hypothetical protein
MSAANGVGSGRVLFFCVFLPSLVFLSFAYCCKLRLIHVTRSLTHCTCSVSLNCAAHSCLPTRCLSSTGWCSVVNRNWRWLSATARKVVKFLYLRHHHESRWGFWRQSSTYLRPQHCAWLTYKRARSRFVASGNELTVQAWDLRHFVRLAAQLTTYRCLNNTTVRKLLLPLRTALLDFLTTCHRAARKSATSLVLRVGQLLVYGQ